MLILQNNELSVGIILTELDVTFVGTLEGCFGLDFSPDISGGVSVFLLFQRVSLDNLFYHLSETNTVLFSLQHLSVDGDLGIQHLFGVQKTLKFLDQAGDFILETSELTVSFVEGLFVLTLIVGQLNLHNNYDKIQKNVIIS